MKKPILAFLMLVVLALAAPAYAEIYKYIDEKGQKRWTDDLSQVPREQRPTAQRIETEIEQPVDAIDAESEKNQPEAPPEADAALPDTDEPGESAELDRDALEKEKAEIDAQYQQLVEERKQLEQMQAEDLSAAGRADLNARISAYNGKMDQYDKQLSAFNEKASAYYHKLASQKQPKPSE